MSFCFSLLIVDSSKQRRKNEKNDKHDRNKGNQNKGPGVLKSSGVFSEGLKPLFNH